MTNQNNEFGKSPVKLSSPTQIWIDDVNQNNELDELDEIVRRIHFSQASFNELTKEELYEDIGDDCLRVINKGKKAIQALYAPKPVENGELRETIDEVFEGLARYNCNAFTEDTLPNEIPPYVAKERVLSLIRTEKLKLLAEVRERVVGEDKPLQGKYRASGLMSYDMTNHYENSLRAEQRAVLTQLEAEL